MKSWSGSVLRSLDEVYLVSGNELFKLRGNVNFDFDTVTVTGSQVFDSIYVEEFKQLEPVRVPGNQLLLRSKNSSLRKPSVVNLDHILSTCYEGSAVGLVDNMSTVSFANFHSLAARYNLRALYGCELNVFFDEYNPFHLCSDEVRNKPLNRLKFLCLDLETNGIDAFSSDIIEVGYVLIRDMTEVDDFATLLHTKQHISDDISRLTGITNSMIAESGKPIEPVLLEIHRLTSELGYILLTHRSFDLKFLQVAFKRILNIDFKPNFLSSLDMFKLAFPELRKYSLAAVARSLNIEHKEAHRALSDARITYLSVASAVSKLGAHLTMNMIGTKIEFANHSVFSLVVYVRNKAGFQELNNLLSIGYTQYYYKFPRIPLSSILKQKNLVVCSSTGTDSFLYESHFFAEYAGLTDSFLDFVMLVDPECIQKANCTRNGIAYQSGFERSMQSRESILNWYESISVPTIVASFVNANYEAEYLALNSLYNITLPVHAAVTTEYCLVPRPTSDQENVRKLLAMIDFDPSMDSSLSNFSSVENYDESVIRELIVEKYGAASSHPMLLERVNFELNLLQKRNLHKAYYLVHRLVMEVRAKFDTVIGSRGSIGSSFLAFILNITEVNPLPAHKFCRFCGLFELVPEVLSGFDCSEEWCLNCSQKLRFDGHRIAFSIFAGLEGEKLPDIDLNIDSTIHDDVQEFIVNRCNEEGYSAVRISSILSLQRRNAYLYVERYSPHAGEMQKHFAAERMVGVKLSTTQHPGGILILPKSVPLETLTAVQQSSGEQKLVSHVDYHSMLGDVFKLDILAHDDPYAIARMCAMTGIKSSDIDFLKSEVLDLFRQGRTVGLPDFGTRFVQRIVVFIKPVNFSELVKISGLTHGTNVWTNNGQELILHEGKSIRDIICVRDDIYDALISYNIDAKLAYQVMEFVRKGQTAVKPEIWNKLTEQLHNVPDWFKESCAKMVYIFPRAHAVAYTILAFKIAYFKTFFPLVFYTCFLNRKIEYVVLDYILMGEGELRDEAVRLLRTKLHKDRAASQVVDCILEIRTRTNIDLRSVDIYNSDASEFRIVDNAIYPPFCTIKGFGVSVGEQIVRARTDRPFTDFCDFKSRTGLGKSKLDILLSFVKLPFSKIEENMLF